MRKQQEKNHQATSNPSALQGGKLLTYDELQKQASAFGHEAAYQGVLGIAGALLSMIVLNTPMGSSFRSIAVRMMVMMTVTLCLPLSVMLAKVIFLNKTAFQPPCSAKFFVGFITGYFRNTKSSSRNFIRRMRMLSVSWCFSSGCLSG